MLPSISSLIRPINFYLTLELKMNPQELQAYFDLEPEKLKVGNYIYHPDYGYGFIVNFKTNCFMNLTFVRPRYCSLGINVSNYKSFVSQLTKIQVDVKTH